MTNTHVLMIYLNQVHVHVFLKFSDIITFRDVSKDTGFQACYHGNIYNDLSQDLYLSNGLKLYNMHVYIYSVYILQLYIISLSPRKKEILLDFKNDYIMVTSFSDF